MELKFKLLFYLILNILTIHVLTQKKGWSLRKTEDLTVDLQKNGKISVPSGTEKIIFNSSEFKKDEEIYFKITAEKFNDERIYFEFLDNLNGYLSFFHTLKYVYCTDKDDKFMKEIKYYTIKKSSENLGSLQGKYLLIEFFCEDDVEIENIESLENIKKSNTKEIVAIIVVVIIVIGGTIFLIYYCYKKKRNAQTNNNNMPYIPTQNNLQNNNNFYQHQMNQQQFYQIQQVGQIPQIPRGQPAQQLHQIHINQNININIDNNINNGGTNRTFLYNRHQDNNINNGRNKRNNGNAGNKNNNNNNKYDKPNNDNHVNNDQLNTTNVSNSNKRNNIAKQNKNNIKEKDNLCNYSLPSLEEINQNNINIHQNDNNYNISQTSENLEAPVAAYNPNKTP